MQKRKCSCSRNTQSSSIDTKGISFSINTLFESWCIQMCRQRFGSIRDHISASDIYGRKLCSNHVCDLSRDIFPWRLHFMLPNKLHILITWMVKCLSQHAAVLMFSGSDRDSIENSARWRVRKRNGIVDWNNKSVRQTHIHTHKIMGSNSWLC